MEKIIVLLWMLFSIYMLVLLAIMADLWAGVRKAKRNGVARTSYGFKRTIDKVARYYNALLALSVIDAMQMSGVWYIESYYELTFIMFPFITLIGAIGMGFIEVKSIYEKAEDKAQFESVIRLGGKVIENKDDIAEISNAVLDYIRETGDSPKVEVVNKVRIKTDENK